MRDPSSYNLLELYRQHRYEIDVLTDRTSLFILAFTNEIGTIQTGVLAQELNLSADALRAKLKALLGGQLMSETGTTLSVTALGKNLLSEIGFLTLPPPSQPHSKPEPPSRPPEPIARPRTTPKPKSNAMGFIVGGLIIAVIIVAAIVTYLLLPIINPPNTPTPNNPLRLTLVSDRDRLRAGECAMLEWSVEGKFTFVELNGQVVPPKDRMQVCPPKTTDYTLVAAGGLGEHTHVQIIVEGIAPQDAQISFAADNPFIKIGDCTLLRWNVQGGLGVYLDKEKVGFVGDCRVCPDKTIRYELVVDLGTSAKASQVLITVDSAIAVPTTPPARILTFTPTRTATRTFTPTVTRTSTFVSIIVPPTWTPTFTPVPVDNTPPAPTASSPSGNPTLLCPPNSVTLTWTSVSDPSGIDRYEWTLERSNNPAGPFTLASSGNTANTNTSATVSCGVWYRWRVRAVDGKGNIGAYSSYANFATGLP